MSIFRRKDAGPRRQWGADSHKDPMPQVPRIAGDWTMTLGRAAVVLTVTAWVALFVSVINGQVIEGVVGHASLVETVGFLTAVTLLAASATAYLFGRLGFYYRTKTGRRTPRAMLDEFYAERRPSVTALIPSYQEEPGVILMTLLSTALQEYPDLRVVLLVDDPPNPRYAGPRKLLDSAVALPAEVERLLSEPRRRFDRALEAYERSADPALPTTAAEVHAAAGEYEFAAAWIRSLSDRYHVSDHNEAFFANHVLGKLSADLAVIGGALRNAADEDPEKITVARMAQLYRRLAWTFTCEVSSFQRKQFASLSGEPNKAMNLNSYIGLMGGAYREDLTPAGLFLMPCEEAEADLVVPESDYVLTIDADSVIMPEYCLRLVHLMEQEEHEKVAVSQSPYSAFPGAATRLERIAGATTDLQHIIHQGMTYNNATFWVGANAILRKRALADIEEVEYKGPFKIYRYISDRTVIEDTESTIDLAAGGWSLYNYNERLAFSATPPDFGSLAIQRNRWANGGLLILPKMWRAVRERRKRGERTSIGELLLRLNYMASTFWASLFVLCLMIIPFNGHLVSPLTYAVAVPYFVVMAVDLKYCGYKYSDALRIYGFNLLLLPVNLAGSLSSIVQALTGAKGKFMRTPKVRNRTVPAFLYVTLPYLLVGWSVYTFKVAYEHDQWSNAVFATINAVLGSYAIVAFIGIRNSLVDIWVNVTSWLYKPQGPKKMAARAPSALQPTPEGTANWELVLYLGHADRRRRPRETPEAPSDLDRAPLTLPVSAPEVDPAVLGVEVAPETT
jgi:cellulose synthase/poly-beta-1,6-N-acetylglucosamine synthase-like glycosyltransferase